MRDIFLTSLKTFKRRYFITAESILINVPTPSPVNILGYVRVKIRGGGGGGGIGVVLGSDESWKISLPS